MTNFPPFKSNISTYQQIKILNLNNFIAYIYFFKKTSDKSSTTVTDLPPFNDRVSTIQ